jgi:hypothetical protein
MPGLLFMPFAGSNITGTNLIITNSNVGTELNQGNSYTIVNTTIDGINASTTNNKQQLEKD